jgi:hypothetical protein
MDAPCRSGLGMKLPGPLRGDGFGDHRLHDILLACGPPCSGAVIDIVFEGYDSSAAANSSVASLMGNPTLTGNGSPDGDDWPVPISAWPGRSGHVEARQSAASRR